MARYLTRQYDTKIYLDIDGDLIIEQLDDYGETDSVVISRTNIDSFVEYIKFAIQDGYEEESNNEMV